MGKAGATMSETFRTDGAPGYLEYAGEKQHERESWGMAFCDRAEIREMRAEFCVYAVEFIRHLDSNKWREVERELQGVHSNPVAARQWISLNRAQPELTYTEGLDFERRGRSLDPEQLIEKQEVVSKVLETVDLCERFVREGAYSDSKHIDEMEKNGYSFHEVGADNFHIRNDKTGQVIYLNRVEISNAVLEAVEMVDPCERFARSGPKRIEQRNYNMMAFGGGPRDIDHEIER
jgi:hypothetical protein